jgi:hypothetical protein
MAHCTGGGCQLRLSAVKCRSVEWGGYIMYLDAPVYYMGRPGTLWRVSQGGVRYRYDAANSPLLELSLTVRDDAPLPVGYALCAYGVPYREGRVSRQAPLPVSYALYTCDVSYGEGCAYVPADHHRLLHRCPAFPLSACLPMVLPSGATGRGVSTSRETPTHPMSFGWYLQMYSIYTVFVW